MEPLRCSELNPASIELGTPGHAGAARVRTRPGVRRVENAPNDDPLVTGVLAEIGLGAKAAGVTGAMDELKAVLQTDYRRVHGLPNGAVAHELRRIVEQKIKPCLDTWHLRKRAGLDRLEGFFDGQEILVHSQPYLDGAGRALWGFSCDARTGGAGKFVIFLNTAHEPGAVAATVGHELGHYIYNSIGAGVPDGQAAMAPLLSEHLREEKELFSDSVVALSAYTAEQASAIARSGRLVDQIRGAIVSIAPQYRIILNRPGLSGFWRVRYLTLIVHFFKLRCALVDAAGI